MIFQDANMWWYGRGNSGGLWLPEEKKANMWHERGNSGGSCSPAFYENELNYQEQSHHTKKRINICLL